MGEISAFCMLSKKTQLKEIISVAKTEGEIIGAQMEYVISRITCQRCPHSSPWNQLNILLHGERDFEDTVKVMDFKRVRLSWIIWCAQSNYMDP